MIKQAFTQGTLEALQAFGLEKWAERRRVSPSGTISPEHSYEELLRRFVDPVNNMPEWPIPEAYDRAAAAVRSANSVRQRAAADAMQLPGFLSGQAEHAKDVGRGVSDLWSTLGNRASSEGPGMSNAMRGLTRRQGWQALGRGAKGLLPSLGLAGLATGGLYAANKLLGDSSE
jgi:hypothetical protein